MRQDRRKMEREGRGERRWRGYGKIRMRERFPENEKGENGERKKHNRGGEKGYRV